MTSLAQSKMSPYVGMILSTTAQVGLIIISKRAFATGMTNYVFVAYSNFLAAIVLLPLSLLVHRSSNRPPLTFFLIFGFFSLGVLGCLAQLTGYTGINYTNAAFASAMLNLIPGFTFLLAVVFGMEKVAFRSSSFLAKVLGTAVSITGAFIVTLYNGPQVLSLHTFIEKLDYVHFTQASFIIGGLFLTLDCALSSGCIILQASILKHYQAELIIVFFYFLFSGILSTIVSLIVDDNLSAWSLQPRIRLLTVLYSGVFGSAFHVGVSVWCLHKKGPLFVAMFHPLGIVISAVIGVIFLGDVMYLGSLVGSIIIVIGFYSVMWGKAKEGKVIENSANTRSESMDQETPFLPIKDEQN